MKSSEARRGAVAYLERQGNEVRDISTGQGRPRLSQIELARDGARRTCSIKVADKAMNGRIHYARKRDEERNFVEGFEVLSDVDLVLHVRPMPDGNLKLTMYEQAAVLDAFNISLRALEEHGKDLPIWVSPEPEPGHWRQIGSGFGEKALWSETVTTDGMVVGEHATQPPQTSQPAPSTATVRPLSIAEAKAAVAAKYEVSPDKVEIIVRG